MDHSRRKFLKFLAAAPAFLLPGMAFSPILRFLKPTMGPMGFFEPSDFPVGDAIPSFSMLEFPQRWVFVPFTYKIKVTEFNAEQQEVREGQGFIVRLGNDEIVAYSRLCPAHSSDAPYLAKFVGCPKAQPHTCPLNVLQDETICHAGCWLKLKDCRCAKKISNPVLYCACSGATFDLANNGLATNGSNRAPQKFLLSKKNDIITIVSLDSRQIL